MTFFAGGGIARISQNAYVCHVYWPRGRIREAPDAEAGRSPAVASSIYICMLESRGRALRGPRFFLFTQSREPNPVTLRKVKLEYIYIYTY